MQTRKDLNQNRGILDRGWMTFLLLLLLLALVAIFVIALKNPELLTKPFKREPEAPSPPKLIVLPMIISSVGRKRNSTSPHRLIILLFPLVACGYVSTSEYLSHIKTINIPMATNRTVEYGLEGEVTKSITDRFRRRWGEGNDLMFTITITDFKPEPIKFDTNNFPEQYSYMIKLDYTLEDRVQNKVISDKEGYVQRHNFYVVQGRGEEPETEKIAREKLLEELAEQLYSDLAEQW